MQLTRVLGKKTEMSADARIDIFSKLYIYNYTYIWLTGDTDNISAEPLIPA